MRMIRCFTNLEQKYGNVELIKAQSEIQDFFFPDVPAFLVVSFSKELLKNILPKWSKNFLTWLRDEVLSWIRRQSSEEGSAWLAWFRFADQLWFNNINQVKVALWDRFACLSAVRHCYKTSTWFHFLEWWNKLMENGYRLSPWMVWRYNNDSNPSSISHFIKICNFRFFPLQWLYVKLTKQ